jgi:hypothetical protein
MGLTFHRLIQRDLRNVLLRLGCMSIVNGVSLLIRSVRLQGFFGGNLFASWRLCVFALHLRSS